MSKDLVRQALDLDDQLSQASSKRSAATKSKNLKKRERRKRTKAASSVSHKSTATSSLIEKNVQTLLKNQKKVTPKRRLIAKIADRQVPKWQLPKKKKKKKKEDKTPDSAYDISDVLL